MRLKFMTVFNYQHLYLYTEANLLRKQMVSLPINAHILHHKQPLHNLSSSSQRHKPTEYNKYRQFSGWPIFSPNQKAVFLKIWIPISWRQRRCQCMEILRCLS